MSFLETDTVFYLMPWLSIIVIEHWQYTGNCACSHSSHSEVAQLNTRAGTHIQSLRSPHMEGK